ncbi:MAG: hypothetical protein AAFU70_03330, partial [Planctomycetota bacterium]
MRMLPIPVAALATALVVVLPLPQAAADILVVRAESGVEPGDWAPLVNATLARAEPGDTVVLSSRREAYEIRSAITIDRDGITLEGTGATVRFADNAMGGKIIDCIEVVGTPEDPVEGVIVRVVEMDHGDGRANGIRLKIAEDVFALGETALVGGDTGDPGDLVVPPQPLARRWIAEAPYWLLVQELGHAQADALLDEDPDAGALVAAGERPSADALSAQVWTDAGQGYALEGASEFVPSALLAADVTEDPAERDLP